MSGIEMPIVRHAALGLLLLPQLVAAAAHPSRPLKPLPATAPPSAPVSADPAVKRGVDLWAAGNYPGAVAAWRPAADAGDADAQFNMGQAYKLGRGVPTDQRQAEGWYRKAAEQGHDEAAGFLGLIMFQNGDRVGALPWIVKAADKGDPRAQYVYGTALFNGELMAKDWPRAYALMTRSAAAGLPQATATLQQMDQFIPLPERQKGLKMATQLARATPAGPAATLAGPTRAAVPIATTAVPASHPAPEPVRYLQPDAPGPDARPKAVPRPVAARPTPARPAPTMPAPARPAATATATARSGSWRVQLGAFGNEAAARAAWGKLHGGALGSVSPVYEAAGTIVRLKAGPLPDRAAATRLCAASRVPGCFPTQ